MVIGRAGYVAGGIIMNQLKPRMLNADGWNWGESCTMFLSGVCKVIDAFTLQARKVVISSLDSILSSLSILLPSRDSKPYYG